MVGRGGEWWERVRRSRYLGRETYWLDLVFAEVWDTINYYPWQGATEIDRLVHDETHDSGGEDIVLHVCVPSLCRVSIAVFSRIEGERVGNWGSTHSP